MVLWRSGHYPFALKTAKPSSDGQIKTFKIVIRDDIAQLVLEDKKLAFKVPSSKLVRLAKIKPMFKTLLKVKQSIFYNENVANLALKTFMVENLLVN